MNENTINTINTISNSRLNQKLININNIFKIDNLNEAYLIQDAVNEELIKNGLGKISGFKIGCTNQDIQKELNVNHPIFGAFFKNKILANQAIISLKNFIQVGVECELYVVVSKNISNDIDYDKMNINNFISYYGLSLEIVENRLSNIKETSIETIIADGSLGNSIILGKKKKNNIKDFSQFLGRIFINEEEIHCNSSKSILGNPLNALIWYFNEKIKLNKNINIGEIISLGSITPLIWIKEPCSVKVSIDNLDDLTINFID